MLLRFFSPPQRKALLLMAYRVVAADGVVRDEETCLLDALRHELSLPAPKREDYVAGPDLSVFGDRRARMAAMLKLASLAYSDRELHPEEVKVLVRFGRSMDLGAEDIQAIDAWGRQHEKLVRGAFELIGPGAADAPSDDGACAHLVGTALPAITLAQAVGNPRALAFEPGIRGVVVCYAVSAVPGRPLPKEWDIYPDSQDSSPLLVGFRDRHGDFRDLGVELVALSSQLPEYLKDVTARLGLRFPVLSDQRSEMTTALALPTLEVAGTRLVRRLVLVVRDGTIEHVFYPVAAPDALAAQVVDWLTANPAG